MDRFKYLALGAVTVLALVLVVGLAAIAGAVATAAIIDDVDEANQEVEASKTAASVEAAVKKALSVAAAKTPATAQVSSSATQSGTSESGIWVTGEGTVTLEPDLALLSLGVEARGETVSDAIAEASTAMEAVLGALRGRGIQDRDIQTRNFRVRGPVRLPRGGPVRGEERGEGTVGVCGDEHCDGQDQGPRLGWRRD